MGGQGQGGRERKRSFRFPPWCQKAGKKEKEEKAKLTPGLRKTAERGEGGKGKGRYCGGGEKRGKTIFSIVDPKASLAGGEKSSPIITRSDDREEGEGGFLRNQKGLQREKGRERISSAGTR